MHARHLTRIVLNTRSKEVRRDLANVHDLHRTVMSMFADVDDENPRVELGVLYRLDNITSGAVLLVQSKDSPYIESLPDGYGAITTISMGGLVERLQAGTNVRYRVVANLVKTEKRADGPGKKVALGRQPALDKWAGIAKENGLSLTSDPQATATTITGKRNNAKITLRPWTIEGTAAITDPAKLVELIFSGAGRGKAYGCGLISIAIL